MDHDQVGALLLIFAPSTLIYAVWFYHAVLTGKFDRKD